jgi:hypothetical protein
VEQYGDGKRFARQTKTFSVWHMSSTELRVKLSDRENMAKKRHGINADEDTFLPTPMVMTSTMGTELWRRRHT